MRRGLMGWSEADLPQAVLQQRLACLQEGLKTEGLDGIVIYTNIARPAAVAFVTGFTPYWSEGLLFIPASGEPVLAVALSKRVAGWVRSLTPIGVIENASQPAAAIARRLQEAGIRKLGVVELDMFPGAQADMLSASGNAVLLEDASALYRSVRLRVDAAEIALARRADQLACDCLEAVNGSSRPPSDGGVPPWGGSRAETNASRAPSCAEHDGRAMVADIEARARLTGAEEVFVGVAPDLSHAAAFLRSDRLGTLGAHVAIRVSLALKGCWIRRTVTMSRIVAEQPVFAAADATFKRALAGASAADALKTLKSSFPGRITAWTVEACVGSYPLEVVAHSGNAGAVPELLPVSVLSVQADFNGITWLGAGPAILGACP
jgi:Creatinase/Prolidase N-terminal domain